MGEYGERNLPQSDQEGEYPSVSLHLGGQWYTRIACVDYTKAFDCVDHNKFWKKKKRIVCAPNKYGRREAWIILENGERVSLYLRP